MTDSGERFDLNIQVTVGARDLPLVRIEQAVTRVLIEHDVAPGTGLSIVITDDEEVRRMNREFRAVDAPTDVLSFPSDPMPVPEIEPYLGDLILGLPYIERQAAVEGHSVSDELVLAVTHGTLHLLGYDHDTVQHQAKMWAVQEGLLRAAGVAITVPLFEFEDEAVSGDDSEGE